MSIGKAIAWIFVTALGIAGIYAGIGVKKLMSICYNIVKYDFKLDFDYIYINLTLQVKNPSVFKVEINGYNLDVYLNNGYVANVSTKKHAHLDADGGINNIVIPIKVPYLKVSKDIRGKELLNAFTQKRYSDIFITLKGTFDGQILKIPAHVPVDYKITLEEIIKIMDKPASAPC